MAKVVALGEILIDFAQIGTDNMGYPTLQAQPGGAPANFLAALTKYGHETAMIGKVGDDAFGRQLVATLDKQGIDTAGVIIDQNYFTTLAFVTTDENGERSFSFARKPGADTQLATDEVDFSLIEKADVFHFGTLSFTHEISARATVKCLEFAKEKGLLISYDPNLRLNLWDSAGKAKEAMLTGMKYADVVKISDEEAEFLWGCGPEKAAEIILADYGVQLVYVTLGKEGCYFSNGKHSGYVDTPEGIQPVDTTGAGDIFGGSAMSGLLQTGKKPAQLTLHELEKICRFATAAASLSTEKPGGMTSVPDISAVQTVIQNSTAKD